MSQKLTRTVLPLTVNGVDVELTALRREGTGTPLVFLHGFGGSKGTTSTSRSTMTWPSDRRLDPA